MGIAAHFIYKEKLLTIFLALIKEDGLSIFNEFIIVLSDYDLVKKLYSATTDSGNKIKYRQDPAIQHLLNWSIENNLQFRK